MTKQQEKDYAEAERQWGGADPETLDAFTDGAEYARRELFEWLRAMYGNDERLERLKKEYDL